MSQRDLCLAVNCGSSSIKFKLYRQQQVVLAGSASDVQGDKPATYKYKYSGGGDATTLDKEESRKLDKSTSYEDVFQDILDDVTSETVLGVGGKDKINVVAHRIVHGGTATEPVVIKHGDKEEQHTLDRMDEVSAFAPLHNHHAMLIVKKCLESLPSATSVLCFDTLFHTTIPEHRTTYAISKPPHKTPVPLVRYGFHGLSYGSIVNQMADELSVPKDELNLVVAHLGSGGSCCLIQNGKSTNTTMGLTPLEGLPGGTRSGSVDPSLIFHHTPDCSETVQWSGRDISKAEYVLNKESGFKAMTGTNDFGEIITRAFSSAADGKADDDERGQALLAYNLYLDRLLGYLQSYVATVFASPAPSSSSSSSEKRKNKNNKLDALVFSGGIGEHSSKIRADVLSAFEWIEKLAGSGEEEEEGGGSGGLDVDANENGSGRRRITKEGSRVPGWVVETDEELEAVQLALAASKKAE